MNENEHRVASYVRGALGGLIAISLAACDPQAVETPQAAESSPPRKYSVDVKFEIDFPTDPYADPSSATIANERDKFGRVVHFFGDSIAGGRALGSFPPEFEPEMITRDWIAPYWKYRSPSAVLNADAAKTGIHSMLSGLTGLPDRARATQMQKMIQERIIRPGDVVVIEDAGEQRGDPVTYEKLLTELRTALSDADVLIVMSTTPDAFGDKPTGNPPDKMAFDIPFNGRSHNDAIRRAAAAAVPGKSRTVLLDMNTALEAKKGLLLADGIHFSVAGQCVWILAIADAAGFPHPECPTDPALNPPFAP